jgi:predicted porin
VICKIVSPLEVLAMNKSLLSLAILGAFAGAASAQSSVTVYGKLDQALAKGFGTATKTIDDTTSASRLGFKGVEDLGGGLRATFGMEHRFSPDTGVPAAIFWNGYSTVGLASKSYGSINLGRQYTAAFDVQTAFDPWGGETVAELRTVGALPRLNATGTGDVGAVRSTPIAVSRLGDFRVSDSIRYDFKAGGFGVAFSIGERPANSPARPQNDRPISYSGSYSAGPLYVGLGVESLPYKGAGLFTGGAIYNFGVAKVAASFSKGKTGLLLNSTGTATITSRGLDATSFMLGATVPVGMLDVKLGYAQSKVDPEPGKTEDRDLKKFSGGLHYNLSKRTKVYTDISGISGVLAVGPKLAYDFGIQHNF